MKAAISFQPEPAYPIQDCQSKVDFEATTSLEDLARYIGTGHLVLWQFHRVFYLPIKTGSIELPPSVKTDQKRFLVRARAFNEDKEWHLWRHKDKIHGRQREDSSGQGDPFVEADMKLRGVIYTQLGVPENGPVVRLKTRSYIQHNTYFQAGYFDQRLVTIINPKEEGES